MDSGDLYHGMTIHAENLGLASLRSVHGRIDGYIMGDVGGSAMCRENHVSHTITFAVGVGGTLVDSVKIHVVASSLMVGGWLVVCFLSTVT